MQPPTGLREDHRGPVKREEEEDGQRLSKYLQDKRAGPWAKRHWRSRYNSQLRPITKDEEEPEKTFMNADIQ